jgi:hypothetical protein
MTTEIVHLLWRSDHVFTGACANDYAHANVNVQCHINPAQAKIAGTHGAVDSALDS